MDSYWFIDNYYLSMPVVQIIHTSLC